MRWLSHLNTENMAYLSPQIDECDIMYLDRVERFIEKLKYTHRREPKSYVAVTVRQLTPRYSQLCSLPSAPLVVFNRTQAKDILKPQYKRLRSFGNRFYGVAYRKANLIWLNPNMDTEQAKDTLAHEFIHLRFPYLSHGEKFDEQIKRLRNGEQFKPYKKKDLARSLNY